MAMTPKGLSQRAVRSYHRYGEELDWIRQLLHILHIGRESTHSKSRMTI